MGNGQRDPQSALTKDNRRSGSENFKEEGSKSDKQIFRFDNVLELYRKYIQKYNITPSLRMQIIYEIYKNKNNNLGVPPQEQSGIRESQKDSMNKNSEQDNGNKIVYLNVNSSNHDRNVRNAAVRVANSRSNNYTINLNNNDTNFGSNNEAPHGLKSTWKNHTHLNGTYD